MTKAFISGTDYGLPKDNLQSYLDEFCLRFSRRSFGPLLLDHLVLAIGLSVRACLTSPRARLGGIFSALTALKILAIRQDCCGFLPCRTKNLSRQSAHAEILNRLLG